MYRLVISIYVLTLSASRAEHSLADVAFVLARRSASFTSDNRTLLRRLGSRASQSTSNSFSLRPGTLCLSRAFRKSLRLTSWASQHNLNRFVSRGEMSRVLRMRANKRQERAAYVAIVRTADLLLRVSRSLKYSHVAIRQVPTPPFARHSC